MFEELDMNGIRDLKAKVKQLEDQNNELLNKCRIYFDAYITEQYFLYKHKEMFFM